MSQSDVVTRRDSGAYWDAEAWDPEERVYVGADAGQQNHLIAAKPKDAAAKGTSGGYNTGQSAVKSGGAARSLAEVGRTNSDAYWGADSWDPEERVYVGAGAGQHNHLTAVEPKKPAIAAAAEAPEKEAPSVAEAPEKGTLLVAEASTKEATTVAVATLEKVERPPGQRSLGEAGRVSSGCYWGAEGWDPEERIYVGAGAGQANHLIAVQPTKEAVAKPSTPVAVTATKSTQGPTTSAATVGAEQPTDDPAQPSLAERGRMSSAAYWDADAWDPEERVYVGADLGQQNHITAVVPKTHATPSPTLASMGAAAKPKVTEVATSSSAAVAEQAGNATPQPSLAERGRSSSAAYWGAQAWDPEERVYVGADIGQQNHVSAVQP